MVPNPAAEWMEGRLDIGRYFDKWDASSCHFIPNAATAAINGHPPHHSLFKPSSYEYYESM